MAAPELDESECWMVFDRHFCPLMDGEHVADDNCVVFARERGDRTFLDDCPRFAVAGGDCILPALHAGPCSR